MKCKKCGTTAVVNMRHHRLALCAEHYVEWFVAYTQRTIEKLGMFGEGDQVLVAISGGKDSLALWDVLAQLGIQADGLYIDLGIGGDDGYSHTSCVKAQSFASERDLKLEVVDIQKIYGESIPELARRSRRGRGKPCSVCGLVKRHVMNRLTLEGGYAALATGHNLDDEAAVLFQNTLRWQTGYLARQAPVLEATHPGLARKVKPFCRLYERETAAFTLVRSIDYVYDECPHATGATSIFYKNLLNQLEGRSPGAKFGFYSEFLRAKRQGELVLPDEKLDLQPCGTCGQPTTAPDRCAFCRLWE
ncbi:MAG TPA: ATP-binding protein [Anaerolineae bacterium]|nr:ATP-binding protein [Anaerolineae bacterium]